MSFTAAPQPGHTVHVREVDGTRHELTFPAVPTVREVCDQLVAVLRCDDRYNVKLVRRDRLYTVDDSEHIAPTTDDDFFIVNERMPPNHDDWNRKVQEVMAIVSRSRTDCEVALAAAAGDVNAAADQLLS
jgi:hypothetical protein